MGQIVVRCCSQITERLHILATWLHYCSKAPKFLLCRGRVSHALCKPPVTQKSFFWSDVCRFICRSSNYFIFLMFSPLQSVLSLFIEHIHIPQTYFRSKLTQPLQAPIPKHGVWYFTMLLLPTSLHSKNNFLECPNLVNIWLWIIYSGNCVKYIHYLCFFC